MNKDLSIIVTSYKNPSVLRLCLDSLKKNIFNLNYEILVLDSVTEEETEMMMREEFPEVRFFPFKENLGFLRLVNKGIKEARGDYYLILNADIIIEKKSVNLLIDYLKNNPSVGIVGPKLLNFDGHLQNSCFRFYTPSIIIYRRTFLGKFNFATKKINRFLLKDKDHERMIEADWIMGSAMMASRRAVDQAGLMDEKFYMYFEDVDWCRRFWEKGFKVIYYPQARMFHYHGKGSASQGALKAVLFNKLTREHIISAIKYFWKYLGKPNPHKL
jgi:N-acetylglucosaminyl-diphospho-decaprenol L-rhamnosyltransferase